MASPFTLAALSVSLLVGVAAGIHLGESAVSMIDPIHFQGPALHPRDRGAAIDERALRASRPAPRHLYGWDEGYAARAAACGDCDAWAQSEAQAYSAVVPYFGGPDVPAEPEGADKVRIARGSRERADNEFAEKVETPERRIDRYAQPPLGYGEGAFDGPLAEEKPVDVEDVSRYEDVYHR